MEGVAWCLKTSPYPKCYHTQFGHCSLRSVVIEEPQKLGECWSFAPLGRDREWLNKNKPPSHRWYNVKFVSYACKGVHINIRKPPKWVSAGAPPLWCGGMADPLRTSPLPTCYHVKFGSSASKGVCRNRMKPQKWAALGPTACGGGMADH